MERSTQPTKNSERSDLLAIKISQGSQVDSNEASVSLKQVHVELSSPIEVPPTNLNHLDSHCQYYLHIHYPQNSTLTFPRGAIHFQEACNNSPLKEFSKTSTPLPPVSRRTSGKKEASREWKICDLGIPKVSRKYATFSSLPTVA